MSKLPTTKSSGFTVIEALVIVLVLLVLGGAGWFVYNKHHQKKVSPTSQASSVTTKSKAASTQTKPVVDAYAGWKTCDDAADGVSFKYPSTWTVNGGSSKADPCLSFTLASDGQELLLQSPASNGLSFMLWYFPAVQKSNLSKENASSNGSDWQKVQSVKSLPLNNGKSLNLISYEDVGSNTGAGDGLISDMGLSDQAFSVGQTFHAFTGVTSTKNSNYVFNLYASLAAPNSQYVQSHSLVEYQAQPAYSDLINIFKSVTYY